jgi:hypothetical protein
MVLILSSKELFHQEDFRPNYLQDIQLQYLQEEDFILLLLNLELAEE